MEKSLKFNSQVCTSLEQSKKLLELGLKPETADCQHCAYTTDSRGNPIPKRNSKWFIRIGTDESIQVCGLMNATFIPAWSLHRLIEILDVWYLDLDFHNFADAYEQVISYFEERVKGGFINKEYLEQ